MPMAPAQNPHSGSSAALSGLKRSPRIVTTPNEQTGYLRPYSLSFESLVPCPGPADRGACFPVARPRRSHWVLSIGAIAFSELL